VFLVFAVALRLALGPRAAAEQRFRKHLAARKARTALPSFFSKPIVERYFGRTREILFAHRIDQRLQRESKAKQPGHC
jgi:hypothetical protein